VKLSILSDDHDAAVSRGPAIRSVWISLYTASLPGSEGEIEYLAGNFGKFGVGGLFLSPMGVASLLLMCKPRVNTR